MELKYEENKQHMFTHYKGLPGWMLDATADSTIKKMQHGLSAEEAPIVGRCVSAAFQMDSAIDIVVFQVQKWQSYGRHPM